MQFSINRYQPFSSCLPRRSSLFSFSHQSCTLNSTLCCRLHHSMATKTNKPGLCTLPLWKDLMGLTNYKLVYAICTFRPCISLTISPCGCGLIVTAIINGKWIDHVFRKEEKRAGGDFRKMGEEFRLERTRFIVGVPFFWWGLLSFAGSDSDTDIGSIFVVACIGLGWSLEARAPLAVTLVMNFFVGVGTSTIGLATVYGQDLKPGQGGAVSASVSSYRTILWSQTLTDNIAQSRPLPLRSSRHGNHSAHVPKSQRRMDIHTSHWTQSDLYSTAYNCNAERTNMAKKKKGKEGSHGTGEAIEKGEILKLKFGASGINL